MRRRWWERRRLLRERSRRRVVVDAAEQADAVERRRKLRRSPTIRADAARAARLRKRLPELQLVDRRSLHPSNRPRRKNFARTRPQWRTSEATMNKYRDLRKQFDDAGINLGSCATT